MICYKKKGFCGTEHSQPVPTRGKCAKKNRNLVLDSDLSRSIQSILYIGRTALLSKTNYGPLLKTHSVSPFFRTFLRDETKKRRPFGVRGLVWFLGSNCIDSAPGPCTREGTAHLHELYITTVPTHKLGIPEFPRTKTEKSWWSSGWRPMVDSLSTGRYFMIFGVAKHEMTRRRSQGPRLPAIAHATTASPISETSLTKPACAANERGFFPSSTMKKRVRQQTGRKRS